MTLPISSVVFQEVIFSVSAEYKRLLIYSASALLTDMLSGSRMAAVSLSDAALT